MKILCAISSLEFTCEHFPGYVYSKETHHPIFYLPQKKLISYVGKFHAGELTDVDSYLLFLAILKSSDLVEFRVPAKRTVHTRALIANNMEHLVKTVTKLNTVITPSVSFPRFSINIDTCSLENISDWLNVWDANFEDFRAGKRRDIVDRQLAKREAALERLIKSPYKSGPMIGREIAVWAANAGNFPTFTVSNPLSKKDTTCSELWQDVIIQTFKEDVVFGIADHDLSEILDHCETNIPAGSIFSSTLFKQLRTAKEKRHNFFKFGTLQKPSSSYELAQDDSELEKSNIQNIINNAPAVKPELSVYLAAGKTKVVYFRDLMRWRVAQAKQSEEI